MIDPSRRFADPMTTAAGEPRAAVEFAGLKTLWFNTGTLCNLTCANCYIESSPRNDRLAYLSLADVIAYLDEIARDGLPTVEIGLTGGEPFMNPEIIAIIETALARGFAVLVLTNAMRPMMKLDRELLRLNAVFGPRLTLRVSVDHYDRRHHEEERGRRSWAPTIHGLKWLSEHGFAINVAGRTRWGEPEPALRAGYAALFEAEGIRIDARSPRELVLFPEMDEQASVPEITTACWGILGVNPGDMMCATSRMVVKHKGDSAPSVMACTLLAYDERFNLGRTLAEASTAVRLNHPHCARFCVLGGGACSVKD
jgi:hypothetical protein